MRIIRRQSLFKKSDSRLAAKTEQDLLRKSNVRLAAQIEQDLQLLQSFKYTLK